MNGFVAGFGALGVVVGALLAVLTLGGLLFRWSKPLREMAQDWAGRDARPGDGVDEVPGVMRQLRNLRDGLHRVEARIDRVERGVGTVQAQVSVNGGQSMRDAVNRIETTVNEQAGR